MRQVELRELKTGDSFSLYHDSPVLEILGARAPEMYHGGDVSRIKMMLSGNTYTLRRVDGAGGDEVFELDLDALEYVYRRTDDMAWQWVATIAALVAIVGLLAVVLA